MGRSAYICPQASCLAAAQKKNRLGRALRASVPDEIYQRLWQRLEPCPWSIQRSSDWANASKKLQQGSQWT
jgi:hypothetical protein